MVQWWERSPSTSVAQVWFWPSAIHVCGLSLLLVLALPRGFFSGFSGFPPFTKTNISKFHFDQDIHTGLVWKPAKADVASALNIVIYLFSFSYNIFVILSTAAHLHPSMIATDQTPTTIYSTAPYQTTVSSTYLTLWQTVMFSVKSENLVVLHVVNILVDDLP